MAFVNVGSGAAYADDTIFSGSTLTGVVDCGGCGDIGNFTNVLDNSLAYNFNSVKNGSNQIDLHITETGVTTLANAVEATGNTSGAGAAGALDYLLTNGSPETLESLSPLYAVTNNQEASDAVSQTTPLLAGGAEQVVMDTMRNSNRIVQARLNSESGFSSGDGFKTDRYFWLKPFGSWADQGDRSGASGYDASTGGVALGADTLLGGKTRLGLAFIYAHSDVDSNSSVAPQSARINSYEGVAYGSYSLSDRTDVNFQADIGTNSNDGKRTVGFASATAFSSYDSLSTHVGAGIEHKYQLDAKTSFVPSLRADYTHVRSDGYSETGAGLFNLNVDGATAQELIVGLDGKFSRPVTKSLTLTANAGVGYDTLADQASITSSFAGGGGAFITRGIDPSPWLGRAGVGAVLNQFSNVEIAARYDLEARSDFTDQTVSLKFRVPF